MEYVIFNYVVDLRVVLLVLFHRIIAILLSYLSSSTYSKN